MTSTQHVTWNYVNWSQFTNISAAEAFQHLSLLWLSRHHHWTITVTKPAPTWVLTHRKLLAALTIASAASLCRRVLLFLLIPNAFCVCHVCLSTFSLVLPPSSESVILFWWGKITYFSMRTWNHVNRNHHQRFSCSCLQHRRCFDRTDITTNQDRHQSKADFWFHQLPLAAWPSCIYLTADKSSCFHHSYVFLVFARQYPPIIMFNIDYFSFSNTRWTNMLPVLLRLIRQPLLLWSPPPSFLLVCRSDKFLMYRVLHDG